MGQGKVQNHFAPERFIFFMSDPPHLLKTVRNKMAASDAGRRTKFLGVGF